MSVLPYNCIRCDKGMLYREPQLCEVCRNIKLWLANELVKATFAFKERKEIMSVRHEILAAIAAEREACARIAADKAKKAWALLGEFAAGDELTRDQQAGEALAEQCEEIAEAIRARKS